MDDVPQRVMQAKRYALSDLTLDEELQPRASIDLELLGEFGEAIASGDVFPPVVVVDDRKTLWLADGYHRWHAHEALELAEIECLVFKGSRDDALRYSLQANAQHGKRPTASDLKRAYAIAVGHEFVDAWDVDAVVSLLRCSERWARELTQPARARRDADRDAEIQRLKAEGLSNRQVAKETGTSHPLVGRVVSGTKRKASTSFQAPDPDPEPEDDDDGPEPVTSWMKDLLQPAAVPDPQPPEPERAARFEDTQKAFAEPGQHWLAVLEVLRAMNALQSVDKLFKDRYAGFDHAVGPELTQAYAWMEEFNRRFTNV